MEMLAAYYLLRTFDRFVGGELVKQNCGIRIMRRVRVTVPGQTMTFDDAETAEAWAAFSGNTLTWA